jgi:uncharacterized protein
VKVVVDTNVFISGVFFGGVPGRILEAWRDGDIEFVLSAEILQEYQRVGQELASQYPGVDVEPFLALLMVGGTFVDVPPLPERVSSDPDDDKFLACALAANVAVVVSGDRDLLDHTGWRGIRVLRPRQFTGEFLA